MLPGLRVGPLHSSQSAIRHRTLLCRFYAKHIEEPSGARCTDFEKAARGWGGRFLGLWHMLGCLYCYWKLQAHVLFVALLKFNNCNQYNFWFSPFVLGLFSICHQVTREEYLWLTASADHSNHPDKVVQGRRAMAMLDLDRNLRAVESQVGYVAEYYQMVPEDCTPKNQILVGRLGKKEGGGDLVG